MIREKRLFCKLLKIKKTAWEMYQEESRKASGEKRRCPSCGRRGGWRDHGWYERSLIDQKRGKTEYERIKVRRVRCESCGHTHALLPDYIIPYSTYSLLFVVRVLAEHYLKKETVERICERYQITASMLYQWKRVFREHKEIWLGVLEDAETSGGRFIRQLIGLGDYSGMFGGQFYEKAARSFLQGHRDAARYRRGVS